MGSYGRLNYEREFFDSRDPGPWLTRRRSSGAHRKTPFPVTYNARVRNAPFFPPSSQLVSFNVLYISTDNHFPAGRGNLSLFLSASCSNFCYFNPVPFSTTTVFADSVTVLAAHSSLSTSFEFYFRTCKTDDHRERIRLYSLLELYRHPWYPFKIQIFSLFSTFSPIRILSHPIFNMRCIPFLLLGLISATYAIPTPLPQAGSQHDRYPSGPLFPLQSITNQVIYEHWARSAETDIEKWTSL
ncbi:hypothetical protein F5878DRAFT_244107 [Lentinula raphanica]|uniref:Uncharacterized protein n=1 Tax=Lentinula raphanica TaxID=153919 RepID=A0AA38P5S3_9AGAR|nr:hypothetical protein F5878DRAFT_244107 [Lentinula raphanica]